MPSKFKRQCNWTCDIKKKKNYYSWSVIDYQIVDFILIIDLKFIFGMSKKLQQILVFLGSEYDIT